MKDPQAKTLTRKSPKIQTIGPTILKQQEVAVWHEGELVKLQAGNITMTLDYPLALKVSQLLRVHGKEAKFFAGDKSKHWSTVAMLTDAEENYKRGR